MMKRKYFRLFNMITKRKLMKMSIIFIYYELTESGIMKEWLFSERYLKSWTKRKIISE